MYTVQYMQGHFPNRFKEDKGFRKKINMAFMVFMIAMFALFNIFYWATYLFRNTTVPNILANSDQFGRGS